MRCNGKHCLVSLIKWLYSPFSPLILESFNNRNSYNLRRHPWLDTDPGSDCLCLPLLGYHRPLVSGLLTHYYQLDTVQGYPNLYHSCSVPVHLVSESTSSNLIQLPHRPIDATATLSPYYPNPQLSLTGNHSHLRYTNFSPHCLYTWPYQLSCLYS